MDSRQGQPYGMFSRQLDFSVTLQHTVPHSHVSNMMNSSLNTFCSEWVFHKHLWFCWPAICILWGNWGLLWPGTYRTTIYLYICNLVLRLLLRQFFWLYWSPFLVVNNYSYLPSITHYTIFKLWTYCVIQIYAMKLQFKVYFSSNKSEHKLVKS